MVAKVSLINAGKDLWSYLCRQMSPPVALASYSGETQLSRVLKTGSLDADVIVLGHYLEDPLEPAHRVRAVSRGAKIFILRRLDSRASWGAPIELVLAAQEQNTMERLICQAQAGGAGRGSGLCLCNYLKNLPVAYLKIDGSFVTDISEDTIDHAMVEIISQPGHVMGIGAIAECAENQQVVGQLRRPGVDFSQGHAMGSPAPMDGLKLLH